MTFDKIDEILARFPGPVTLHADRGTMLGRFAASLLLVVVGVFIILFANSDPTTLLIGLSTALFFGACVVVIGAMMLLPKLGSLTLDAEGFELCRLFCRYRASWSHVRGFTISAMVLPSGQERRVVGYDVDRLKGFAADYNRGAIGHNAALLDCYRLSLEDLARLMIEWRQCALARRSAGPVPPIA